MYSLLSTYLAMYVRVTKMHIANDRKVKIIDIQKHNTIHTTTG